MLDLKEEQKGTYREKVTGMAKKIGFQVCLCLNKIMS